MQACEDPHVKAIGIVKEVSHPTAGSVKLLGSAVKFSHFSKDPQSPPLLGQHTEEVLKTMLKYSDEKIDELKSKQVIK